MSTKKETLERLNQFHPGDFVQLSDDVPHDEFKGMKGRIAKIIKCRSTFAVDCTNGKRCEVHPAHVTLVLSMQEVLADCKLDWKAHHNMSIYRTRCGVYEASVSRDFENGRWILSCNELGISQQPLSNDDLPRLHTAEGKLRDALINRRDQANRALRDFGIATSLRVNALLGYLEANVIANDALPGISIDLHPFGEAPACNLLQLQLEDTHKLRATVYAELGSNPCDGSVCGDYSHSICFTGPGEAPEADINPRWASCANKTALYEASAEYDYRMAREMIINRMASRGYDDPERHYTHALEQAVSEYLKNRGYGCDEEYSLAEAMSCLPEPDEED